MDLSKLNLAELKDLQAQVGVELKNREKSEVEKARNDIEAIAKSLGLSLKDLLGDADTKGEARKQTGKVAAQYRNPQSAKRIARVDWSRSSTGLG
jgi:DNA-binding protein H-NS